MEEDIIDLGTWRGNLERNFELKNKHNSWFLATKPEEIHINKKDNSLNAIHIYMVQLHAIEPSYSFNPKETKVSHFKFFVKEFWNTSSDVAIYNKLDRPLVKKKITKILDLIFRDSSKNKLIIFPENVLPEISLKELKNRIENFRNKTEKTNVILIGGVEHVKSTTLEKIPDAISKRHKKKGDHSYVNKAVLIDNSKEMVFQAKQTPVLIKDTDLGNIREGIRCVMFPKVKIFQTTFGRIAIFICKDFLRLYDVIAEWVKENNVDFIVVPSLSSKVLPFNYQVIRIFNEPHDPKLKIIYVNVGEYGGSEFYSRERINEIEYKYQKNIRDNVGEVIVTRTLRLNQDNFQERF